VGLKATLSLEVTETFHPAAASRKESAVRSIFLAALLCVPAFAAGLFVNQSIAQDLGGRADLSAAQNVALRFPDQSASQHVALSFSDLGALEADAARPTDALVMLVALGQPEPLPSKNAVPLVGDHLEGADSPVISSRAVAIPSKPAPLIGFEVAPALPPIGHSRFCVHYPQDCRVQGIDFRKRNIAMTSKRWDELNQINRDVNNAIFAVATAENDTVAEWAISPSMGDCKDYAITKRHELLVRGWPSRSLLLSDVVLPSGEHHLLLVVRVKDGNLVLDNLSNDIRLVAIAMTWTRIQSPLNPMLWMRVQNPTRIRAVDLGDGGDRSR
jgi:predicted transglutaminase-like cysteine proteinase